MLGSQAPKGQPRAHRHWHGARGALERAEGHATHELVLAPGEPLARVRLPYCTAPSAPWCPALEVAGVVEVSAAPL
jgi:hypothetical protein